MFNFGAMPEKNETCSACEVEVCNYFQCSVFSFFGFRLSFFLSQRQLLQASCECCCDINSSFLPAACRSSGRGTPRAIAIPPIKEEFIQFRQSVKEEVRKLTLRIAIMADPPAWLTRETIQVTLKNCAAQTVGARLSGHWAEAT